MPSARSLSLGLSTLTSESASVALRHFVIVLDKRAWFQYDQVASFDKPRFRYQGSLNNADQSLRQLPLLGWATGASALLGFAALSMVEPTLRDHLSGCIAGLRCRDSEFCWCVALGLCDDQPNYGF